MEVKVAGVPLPNLSEYKISYSDIQRINQTANGSTKMDYIATKRKLTLGWRYLSDSQLDSLYNLLNQNRPFFSVEYMEAGRAETMVCYVESFDTSLWNTIRGQRYWENVTLSLMEQ